jgi:hypothetical protein
MAVEAPNVEYYRLVDDGTGMDQLDFLKDGNNAVVAANFLDFGIVDAGNNTYKQNVSDITADNSACQVYAIFNNKGGQTDRADMQNAWLSVVSNEEGQQGSSQGDVFERKWIQVVLNDHDEATNAKSLGKYSAKVAQEIPGVTADTEETKLQLTALGIDESTQAGTIKGAQNGGALTDTQNYARVKVWLKIEADAPAGPHLFRLRTTYSYT